MWKRISGWARSAFASGTDPLDQPTLLRSVEDGVLALGRRGEQGRDAFPPGVRVRVTVRGGGVETVRGFVTDPAFDRDVESALANRLVTPSSLPARRYEVVAGDADGVEVLEDARVLAAVLVVEGGDRDGDRYPIENVRRDWRVGRGRWHAESEHEQRTANDIVVTDEARFVSRAAAVIRRGSGLLEVETRNQGDCLVVVRRDGTRVRPALVASGRCPLEAGDCVEFHDGDATAVRLRVTVPEE
jgi:hypothetical protein